MRRVLLTWGIIFISWALYRSAIVTYEWIDELVVKPLFFILPVIAVVRNEKNPLASLGLSIAIRDIFLDVYFGVILGIMFAFEGLWSNYFKYGDFSFHPIQAVAVSAGIVPFIITNAATALSEELLGRGFFYLHLMAEKYSQFSAAVVSSLLFLFLHIPILVLRLHLDGMGAVVYLMSVFFLGFVNCYVLTFRKSLVLPILIHLFWNMTIALYL